MGGNGYISTIDKSKLTTSTTKWPAHDKKKNESYL
jgi:hypothetical protein